VEEHRGGKERRGSSTSQAAHLHHSRRHGCGAAKHLACIFFSFLLVLCECVLPSSLVGRARGVGYDGGDGGLGRCGVMAAGIPQFSKSTLRPPTHSPTHPSNPPPPSLVALVDHAVPVLKAAPVGAPYVLLPHRVPPRTAGALRQHQRGGYGRQHGGHDAADPKVLDGALDRPDVADWVVPLRRRRVEHGGLADAVDPAARRRVEEVAHLLLALG